MIKMLLEMDKEKIEREDEYDLKEIEEYLMEAFSIRGIHKDDTGFYVGGNFATFGGLILSLKKEEWFLDNVKVWKWYNSDGQMNPEDFSVEDIAAYFRNKKRVG